ncbi:conserved protein of unknown function [Trichlorobacter ammonificans]|uniref:Pilus assembly protein PilW n=2 Tax=Trichlorobacter ammonificans TaxID=2916410 RepID=A0ABN8HGL7_9BACT|nr:conserved protein of unknown function [Trichlorobacter ammonificans]
MNGARAMLRKQRGFTLVELIVVMAVFMVVLMITASSFDTILKQAGKLFRSEESNIEGIVGLEMLRHDLQQAGYGLFTEPTAYANEAVDAPASSYNDAPDNVPRPVVLGNNVAAATLDATTVMAGSDYLTIKGTTVGRTKTAQKWTFLRISSSMASVQKWASNAENFDSGDRAVLIRKQFGTPLRSSLMRDPTDDFYYAYSDVAFEHLSSSSQSIYTLYGVDTGDLRFPFNRSDYFVAVPGATSSIKLPAYCAPGTGILYKTTVKHADGKLLYLPLLDCVLDMQVVLGWDMNNDGMLDTYSNADGSQVNSGIAEGTTANVQAALGTTNNNSLTLLPNIRSNLKMVKVYVLAQNGRRDSGYSSPSPLAMSDDGEASLTRAGGFTLAANQLNYRWKLHRIVVRPKNLLSNQ